MQSWINIVSRSFRAENIFLTRPFLKRTPFSRYFRHQPQNSLKSSTYPRKAFNITDLFQHIRNGKVFYLKQLRNVFETIEFDKLKLEESLLLLKCCGSFVPDSSRKERDALCQKIFQGLQKASNLSTGIVNQYIKTCTENDVTIYNEHFLWNINLNNETYKLLLENVCQVGNVEDTFNILEMMKEKGVVLDIESISNLILAHTIHGGLKSAESVLETMRTAQISERRLEKIAILKGLIRRKNLQEFKKAVEKYPVTLTEEEFLDFIQELGLNGLESWLIKINDLSRAIPITRDFQGKVEKICIHLIHMKQPQSAINIYENFIDPIPESCFGYSLLKEMLHCDIDINTIISIARSLVEKELNLCIFEKLTELALRFKYEEQSWALLECLQAVRPHYFWPLLINSARLRGENGVFNTLKQIKKFNIKLDSETLEFYVLPYCELSNPKLLVMKLQDFDFTASEIVTSLLKNLLRVKNVKRASELCRLYPVNIIGDNFLELLAKAWVATEDSSSAIHLLTRYCESNETKHDLVGKFLLDVAKSTKNDTVFLELLAIIHKNGLRISCQGGDKLLELGPSLVKDHQRNIFKTTVHSLVDISTNFTEVLPVPHPKTLDLDGLECHLIELQEKNMEIRGVLRRLIQMHAKKKNMQRVTELRRLFTESNYIESPGMKSSIMHSYILEGHLEEALELYEGIVASNPEFPLDSFKYIDLAKLLIDNDRFKEGFNILQKEVSKFKVKGNVHSIERNCRELLNACKNPQQVEQVFQFLLQNSLITMSNIMLGPLVRIHLKSGDINKAVEKYLEFATKYKYTPLQFEIFSVLTKLGNSEWLEKVLKATKEVHGPGPAQVGLISALAENGQENILRKTLLDATDSIKGLIHTRCKRWVEERKLEPLKCLLLANYELSTKILDEDFVLKCIFDIYDLNHDCEGAKDFLNTLPEDLRSLNLESELQKLHHKNIL